MHDRHQRLHDARQRAGYDAYIATQRANHLYFIQPPQPVSDVPPVTAILFDDDAPMIFPGAAFVDACRDHLPGYAIAPTDVGADPDWVQLAAEIKRRGLRQIVVDVIDRATEAELRAALPGVEITLDGLWGPTLRRTKGPGEIEILREAARISDLGMVAAYAAAKPGVSGREIAAVSAAAMLAAGAEEAALQVAVGPATAYQGTGDWVYDPRRVLEAGDMLLVDMAIRYHGYLGDQTRTAIVGAPTPERRHLIELVQEAYHATVTAMRPGAAAPDLYHITTDLLERHGLRRHFPHHISHGLGLGGDLPRVAQGSEDVLQAGDALSCEPGVYVPGIGGARFENMLLITDTGVEELTRSPIDPIISI